MTTPPLLPATTKYMSLLKERQNLSESVLRDLRDRLSKATDIRENPSLAVYATGSFARREASRFSDIDLFFVDTGTNGPRRVKNMLCTAEVVRQCQELKLPEFSRDGAFLTVHSAAQLRQELGSPNDDHQNYFTARLLLILESTPICNDTAYESLARDIVESYYRDYHDHEKDFQPVFLANDIIRYWKTMCLNYEHTRNRPSNDLEAKHKNHLKNLKLKYSRMATCFSTLIALAQRKSMSPDEVIALITKPPLERLRVASQSLPDGGTLYSKLVEEYCWFLEQTGRTQEEACAWLSNLDNRVTAFRRARAFGQTMYELLLRATHDSQLLRYIVI